MNTEQLHKEIADIEKYLMNEITSYDPLPEKPEDYLQSEQYKILKNYLAFEKNSIIDLMPIDQWRKALTNFLPDKLKYMTDNLVLVDYPLTTFSDYNKIQEEFYANVNAINRFAMMFIAEKNKGEVILEPIQVANVLKHLAEGILAETYKFKFYKNAREQKLRVSF